MTVDNKSSQELRASLRGRLCRPDEDGYDAARKVFNGMIDKPPALIVRCARRGGRDRSRQFRSRNGDGNRIRYQGIVYSNSYHGMGVYPVPPYNVQGGSAAAQEGAAASGAATPAR